MLLTSCPYQYFLQRYNFFYCFFHYFCAVKNSIFHNRIFYLYLLFSLIFINTENLTAKTTDTISGRNIQVEVRTSYGFIVCHHPEMIYFRAHFPLYEVSVQQATFGKHYWEACINYPAVGVSFLYTGLGGFQELGEAYALYPYLSFNFLKSRRNQLNLKMGVGVGYITKTYDPKENPKNTFIGDHYNAIISLAFEYNRFITNRFSLAVFTGFTHFSNGARRSPNNGINIAHIGLSAKYFINEPKQHIPRMEKNNAQYKPWTKKNLSLYVAFTYAPKDIEEYIGYNKTWSVYNLEIDCLKRVTEMSKIGLGFDFVFDETDKAILDLDHKTYSDIEILRPGVNVAYELSLNTTSFMVYAGVHLAGKEMGGGRLYQKLSAKQNICKHMFAICTLTTHFGWADFFSFGIGYKIN